MRLNHASIDRLVLYNYRKGLYQSYLKEMLADFKGIIQTDSYKVYDSLYGNHIGTYLTFCIAIIKILCSSGQSR